MRSERAGKSRCRIAARLRLALEDRFARFQRASGVASGPGVGQGEDRHGGRSRTQELDLALADRLACRPGRELVHLLGERVEILLPDELEEQGAGLRLGSDSALRELLGDPALYRLLRHRKLEDGARFRALLPEGRRLPDGLADEREHRRRRGTREVRRQCLDVRGFPPAFATTVGVAAAVYV